MILSLPFPLPFYNESTRTNVAKDVLNTDNPSFAQVLQFADDDVYNHLHPSPAPTTSDLGLRRRTK